MKGLKTRILFDSQNFRNGSEISHIYNSAANIFARINNTDLLIYNYADSTFVTNLDIDESVGNWSADKPNYYNKSETYSKSEVYNLSEINQII